MLMAYRVYMTDATRFVAGNTAKINGGTYPVISFSECVGWVKPDNRSGDEVAAEIIDKAGLVVKD